MSMEITETRMTSLVTRHTAERDGDSWAVTWLPGRALTRDQAITALTIAELAANGMARYGTRNWPAIQAFAEELDLTTDEAVAMAGPVGLRAFTIALQHALRVPIPAHYDDRNAAADLLKSRANFICGVLTCVSEPRHFEAAVSTLRDLLDRYPVTYTTAEDQDGRPR